MVSPGPQENGIIRLTFQPVNCPLLKLLERDFGSWRHIVEIETMGVVLLLIRGCRELLLFVVENRSSFRVNSLKILSYHLAAAS